MPDENHPHILIIDDAADRLCRIEGLLALEGYRCSVVRDGGSAARVAASEPPDLIVIDVAGSESACETSRTLGTLDFLVDTPLLIACDPGDDPDRVFDSGAADYVSRPVHPRDLLARVETHVSLRRLRDEVSRNGRSDQDTTSRMRELSDQVALFKKFVPPTFMKAMNGVQYDVVEGIAREEQFTVLCCDIRRFTTFSESISCTNVYRFLNSYFAVMEPGVREYGGFVYQYVGDEIMALFDLVDDTYSDSGVRAALAFQKRILPEYNEGRARAGYDPIEVGVGVNTGPVAIGIAGTPHRMDACAFGGSVNLAARCQSLTKEFKAPIIITDNTYRRLRAPADYEVKALGKVEIRGMEEKVSLYEVLDGEI